MGNERDSERVRRWAARLVGVMCVVAFFGLATVDPGGFHIEFRPPFTRTSPGEAHIWLGSVYLLFPGCCALGYGFRDVIARAMYWLRAKLAALSAQERRVGTLCLSLLAVSSARTFNHLVLLGYPVTDDEWAVRFGGEVLAAGKLITRLPFKIEAFPSLFMFVDHGRLTSLDWLGVQLPWAISTLTHTGNWIFAILAAVPVPCLIYILGKRLGPSWALAGIALFACSPMAFALSMSTHAHLASRAWIAVALALYVLALDRQSAKTAFLQGLALGMSIISRPFETCFVCGPLYLAESWRTLRHGDRGERLRWLLFALGVAIPVLIFFAHSYAVTGGLLPPRHHPQSIGQGTREMSYWVRFGSNSAFNALRLAVFFAGPLGVLLFMAGALTNRFTALLSLGILSVLLLGLFHDNYGVHLVGPIHYSECAVPLTLVCIHGLHRITRGWQRTGFAADLPLTITATWLLLGLGIFNVLHAQALHDSSQIQNLVYERIEREVPRDKRPAIVFAPGFASVWLEMTPFKGRGSWVFEWKRPRPDMSDDILILHGNAASMGSVRTAYPDRHFFFLHRQGPDKWFEITDQL